MDKTTAQLVDYAMSVQYADLSDDVVRACKTRLVDTLGCAIGAYHAPLSTLVREIAQQFSGTPAATVLGCEQPTSAEMAAFANGTMLRFLDLSDSYRVKSGGHPSDVLAAILAIAESVHADGKAVITAIATAYEIYCCFCEAIDINSRGWDQPVYGVLASALATGQLLRLTREQMGHLVALAMAPNMALHQARRGELSNWKNAAAANGARNAVFAAMLARAGVTGPAAIFEGKAGVWEVVGRFQFRDLDGPPQRITRTHIKSFPVNYHGQSAVWAALELRERVTVDRIAGIHVEGYHSAVEEMASDPAHWAPLTHETADHSIPYAVATALLDGEITPDSFTEEKLRDPRKARLMKATTVVEKKEYTAQFPASAPCRVAITLDRGEVIESSVSSPRGHADNPLGDADLENKFLTLSRGYCDEARARSMLSAMRDLENARDIRDILRRFVLQAG